MCVMATKVTYIKGYIRTVLQPRLCVKRALG